MDTFELFGTIRLYVSDVHKVGTDALLLSEFAAPRTGEWACDLGSGCGTVAARWFCDEKPAPARVYAVELQADAVRLMERSVVLGGLPAGRFIPVHADLRALQDVLPAGAFGLVTCNPPYKAAGCGLLSEAPGARTARHEIDCTLEDVCAAACRLLRYGGRLCICQRPERLADAVCAMRAHSLEPKRLRMVQHSASHAPWLFLLEARRGGRPSITIEPPKLF
ncbi:methyltransferase [Anaerotruncus colihominis]|uniref:tRNA1(Val) (adenine(37)-N6)-methyltransferase n=1 Tax=Anaerotruncus colihominis TaxID=169435 RepID=UPI003516B440